MRIGVFTHEALFPALLIITACLNRAERQPSSNSTSTRPVRPAMALRSAIPVNKADTGFWADTSARHGDTVFYHRGRAITSVQVLTDSTWFQLYGIPFGLFGSGTAPRSSREPRC
jgi:hypothetical protein